MSSELVKYTTEQGTEIRLTDSFIRDFISTSPNVTDKEVLAFALLCKAHRLDPTIKEAYLIKYGNSPATIVVGKDVFTKRAARNPRFRGYEAGISVQTADGRFIRRAGSMVLMGETIVGGWCRVYIEGYENPMFDEVTFEEYVGRRKDGQINAQWVGKPGTMIRKVAIVHALREAFPEDLCGLYDAAEMGVETNDAPVDAPQDYEAPSDYGRNDEPYDTAEWSMEL